MTFVAMRRVGVGPGVKMLDHSSSMKEAMVVLYTDWSVCGGGLWSLLGLAC